MWTLYTVNYMKNLSRSSLERLFSYALFQRYCPQALFNCQLKVCIGVILTFYSLRTLLMILIRHHSLLWVDIYSIYRYILLQVFFISSQHLRWSAGVTPAKKLLVIQICRIKPVNHTDYSFIELNVQILTALIPCSHWS